MNGLQQRQAGFAWWPGPLIGAATFGVLYSVHHAPTSLFLAILGTVSIALAMLVGRFAARVQALRQSEARIRKIADSSLDAIYAVDREGRFTYVSPAAKNLAGFAPEEVLGRSFVEFIIEEERSRAIETFQLVMKGQKVQGQEFELLTRHGTRTAVEINTSPLCDGEQIIGAQGIVRDIAERKRAEQRLAHFWAIVNSSQDAIIGTTLDGLVTSWNPGAERLYGYTAEEAIGRPIGFIEASDHSSEMPVLLEYIRHGRAVHNWETVCCRKDGGRIPVSMSLSPTRDTKGRIIGESMIVRDISAQKRAEETLREREKRLSSILHNASDIIYTLSSEGLFTFVSPAWTRRLGHDLSEVEGHSFIPFVHPEDAPRCLAFLEQVLRTGDESQSIEYRVRHKNGTWRWHRSTGGVIRDSREQPLCFVGVAEDVTERKQTEAQLDEAKRAAEAANRAKSEFLANTSHELRTPMTAILGYADLLQGIATQTEEIEAAQAIRRNGEYLLSLINGILDLSKIEAGKAEVEHVTCSPVRLVIEVASLMRIPAAAKNLPLEIEFDGPLPETIHSDPMRLRQILLNLVGNAIKFTEVGRIRLVTRFSHDAVGIPLLQFDVIDTGIGMTAEEIDRLFQPFAQVDGPSRKGGGNGLGLTIAKRLAEMLEGTISVTSRLGQGSTFRLTVGTGSLDGVAMVQYPAEALSIDALVEPLEMTSHIKLQGRILLVEDGPDNQRLVAFMLRKAGAQVEIAQNGQVALERVLAAQKAGQPFDLILMDIQMPVMDGYEATRRLREAGYSAPIVALTAHALAGDRANCLAAGCTDYVTKPIEKAPFLALLAHYLPRRLMLTH